MTISLNAAADGLSGTIMVNGADALKIDSVTQEITAVAPYRLAGDGPAVFTTFSGTTVNPATVTVLTLNTPVFDTAADMNTTNGRFTPSVAGYYQCNAEVSQGAATSGGLECRLRKSGTDIFATFAFGAGDVSTYKHAATSGLVYMNGTTDYIEVIGYCATTAFTATGRFSASLVKGA